MEHFEGQIAKELKTLKISIGQLNYWFLKAALAGVDSVSYVMPSRKEMGTDAIS